jgi:hypothetical protein
MKALESFVGSIGIACVGMLTIPFAAEVAGAAITTEQAAKMSAVFFLGRWCWLYVLRSFFEWKAKR